MKIDPKIRALDVCIQQIRAGASVDEALEIFPQWADELRPLLEAAQRTHSLGLNAEVPNDAQSRSRARLAAAAQAKAASRRGGFFSWMLPFSLSMKFALASMLVLIVLVGGAASTVAVSAGAVPGDLLYPVKLAAEQTRMMLTEDEIQRLKLEQRFDQTRVAEVETLIQRSSLRSVKFAGGVTSMQGENWIVGGIQVSITPQTDVQGEVQAGYYIDVEGSLQPSGIVLASRVSPRTVDFSGRLESINGSQWVIGGLEVTLENGAFLSGSPSVGNQVNVTGVWLSGNRLLAQSVSVLQPGGGFQSLPFVDTSTPSPPPSPSSTASPSETPTHTLEPDDGEQQETIESDDDDREMESTPKPSSIQSTDDDDDDREDEDATKTPKPTDDDDGDDESTETPKPTEDDDDHSDDDQRNRTPEPTDDDD